MVSITIGDSPIYNRHAVDIRATYLKHKNSVPILLKLHATSGCDTVAQYHIIAKIKALKALNLPIRQIHDTNLNECIVYIYVLCIDFMSSWLINQVINFES